MNHPVDVHPEDLLDREQLGLLSADEQKRLDAHATQCAACALVRSAAVDFAHERAPVAGDESMTERIVAAAMGNPLASFRPPPPAPSSGYVSSHPRRKRRAWAVAGVVMFAATGATASFWSVRHAFIQRLLFSPAPVTPTAIGGTPGRSAAPSPPTPNPVEAPAPAMKDEAPAPTAQREAPASARPKPEAEVPAPNAEDVLTAANEARHRGDSAQAMKLYRQLQQQFPGSRQETTSRMLLGRLLLDRGEDPSQALSLFTRYLDASPNGTLAEEARLGRAQSLQRLGRPAEERQAWQQLLSAHPNSIHAERAKKRLDELR
jgi:Tetratricopeptide repeat